MRAGLQFFRRKAGQQKVSACNDGSSDDELGRKEQSPHGKGWYNCDIFLFDVASMMLDGKVAPPPPPPATIGSSDTPSSSISRSIRSKLTKEHKGTRNPLFYYEKIQTLGKGSMGWVAKVKKKDHIVGGTARQEIVEFFAVNGGGENTGAPDGKNNVSDASKKLDSKSSSSRILARGASSQYEIYFALKSIRYDRVADVAFLQELKNEVDILRTLDHPHIVKAMETFELPDQLFMVLELCDGGDLYCRDPYTEEEAARIVSSILSAVAYMHSHNITHRDLKYENILFANNDPLSDIKLIDFGLSKKYAAANDIMTESVGTIYTMAPEVLKGRYTSQADVWSIGVIAYMLLSSLMPFYGETRNDIMTRILKCKYDFKGRRWKKVSEQAKAFVSDLLVLDYDECPTAEEAYGYPWLNLRHKASVRNPEAEELKRIRKSITSFVGYNKVKKLALMIIGHQSTTEELGILRKVFQQFDADSDGNISFPEFRHALNPYGYNDSELENMFNGIAFDGSGQIKYTEFIAATIESLGPLNEERVAEAFDRLDCDDAGQITSGNLRELLGDDISMNDIDQMIREAAYGEDAISYPAFLAFWDTEQIEGSTASSSATDSISRDSETKHLTRSDNEHEKSLARTNFLDGKMESERKFGSRDARQSIIDIGDAQKLTVRLFQDLGWQGQGDEK